MEIAGKISRKDKALTTRNNLIAVAERLFTKHGYDSVSVDRIVETAGLAKGTFYVHFKSKDELLISLISDYVEAVDLDYQEFIESFAAEVPVAEILLALVERISSVIKDYIGVDKMKALYKAQLAAIDRTGTAASDQRLLYSTIKGLLARGIEKGEFTTNPALDELANHMVLSMRGLAYEWCIRYPDFDLEGQADQHFRLMLIGILKRHSD